MKKGFTIIELLVASLLLGMLVSILTMLFNQSSIAWRTGVAGVADLSDVRENIACLREEADSLYVWGNDMHRTLSLWDEKGDLRTRAISVESYTDEKAKFLGGITSQTQIQDIYNSLRSVGTGAGNAGIKTFIVNVKSAGPNGVFGDWDDIWSFPDDFE